ncbi:MAG: glycerophosphodiester phosphodiesterase family protein [Clostridia bacterium]|nr:glycerophosphodiester phosphodiesterase family protein [Clostridia bacterium]
MNVEYRGSKEVILSSSPIFNALLRDEAPLGFVAKEDGAFHPIEDVVVSEGALEGGKTLGFGSWRYAYSGCRAVIEGAGAVEVTKAIYAFLQKMARSKEEPIPSAFRFEHQYTSIKQPFSLDGKTISRYQIFYSGPESSHKNWEDFYRFPPARQAAEDLADFIGTECASLLRPLPYLEGEAEENAIVIAPFQSNTDTRYGDWKIETKGTVLLLLANDVCGWEAAVSRLCELLKAKKKLPLPLFEQGALQRREEYEKDPEAFRPCYQGRITKKLLPYEEKAAKLAQPTGAPFIIAHRGEHTYYPENSLEASLSAWRCGADSSEVDLARTRDGIFVLMHDASLLRTTDAEEKMGKNGLPDSDLLSDWTLAELRQLRLKDTHGTVTDFLIPTLEELFRCCDGRVFLHLDKKFDYETELFPLLRAWKTYRCLYLCNYVDLEGIIRLKNTFRDEGVILPSILRIREQNIKKMAQSMDQALANTHLISPAVVYINDFIKNLEFHRNVIRQYTGKLRMASWMMWDTDSPFYWQDATKLGFNIFMTNFPIRIQNTL